MSVAELEAKVKELRSELLRLNTQKITKKSVEKPGRVKAVKRTIAHVLTVLRQKQLSVQPAHMQP